MHIYRKDLTLTFIYTYYIHIGYIQIKPDNVCGSHLSVCKSQRFHKLKLTIPRRITYIPNSYLRLGIYRMHTNKLSYANQAIKYIRGGFIRHSTL